MRTYLSVGLLAVLMGCTTATPTTRKSVAVREPVQPSPPKKEGPVRTFELDAAPVIGRTAAGDTLRLGGFSGLAYLGQDKKTGRLRFVTHTDRGPNTEPVDLPGSGGETRGFPLPGFQPRLIMLDLDLKTNRLSVSQQIKLWRQDGSKLSGLPNAPGLGKGDLVDEVAVDLSGKRLPADPYGADLEGVTIAAGSYWMGDEYRPSIFRFDMSGRLQQRYVPIGANRGNQKFGVEALPAVLSWRKGNRGIEGIAADDGLIYAIVQSPLEPKGKHKGPGNNCRLVALSAKTGKVVGHYIYTMEKDGKSDKIGDMTAVGGGRFLVLERDDDPTMSAQKQIFVIDVKGATNLAALADAKSGKDAGLDALTFDELIKKGVIPVAKRLVVDLPRAGFIGFEKLEGLAIVDNNTLAIVNDNDFGLGGDYDPKTGRLVPNPKPEPSALTLITVKEGW